MLDEYRVGTYIYIYLHRIPTASVCNCRGKKISVRDVARPRNVIIAWFGRRGWQERKYFISSLSIINVSRRGGVRRFRDVCEEQGGRRKKKRKIKKKKTNIKKKLKNNIHDLRTDIVPYGTTWKNFIYISFTQNDFEEN